MGSHRLRTVIAVVATAATGALSLGGAGVAAAAFASAGPPAATAAAAPNPVNIVDKDATAATKSLFSYLDTTRGRQVLFGAQHTTDNGITFTSTGPTETRSDVLGAVGDYPAIFGFDTLILEGGEGPGVAGRSLMENVAPFVADIQTAHRLGGIPEISAHMENFATGNNFNDPTGETVSHILPGGDKNAAFNEYLDAIAAVANTSTDAAGKTIPMIFRPFHENTGNWFWWGAGRATTGEYKELYRYTVEYLRDTQHVHNLLYAFSPNGSFAGDQTRYLATYPGDPWVDILGYDAYENSNEPDNSDAYIGNVVTDLAMVSRTADAHHKIAAFTEFGRNGDRTIAPTGNKSLKFFTDLLNGIKADPDARRIAYMLTWANFGPGQVYQIYVPNAAYTDADGVAQPANELLPDFQAYYADPYSGFARDIPADALTQTGLTATPATPTLRVVSPAAGVRITDPTTTVRVKATVDTPTAVTFTAGDDATPRPLTLGADGYWEGTWNIGSDQLTNASSRIDVTATYSDGATMTTASDVILGAAPTLPNGVVDTFEGYGDNPALQGAYTFNNTTASDLTLDTTAASEGRNGVRFAYDFSGKDYQGFGRAFTPTQDWSGFDQVDAHLLPDGSNQKIVLQFTAGGATFEAYPSLAGTTPLELKIPFSQFQDKAGSHPAPTAEQLKTVSQFYVYLNKTDSYTGPGSIGLDDIHAGLAATPPGPTVIAVPTAPVWTDACGPDNNGRFSGYTDTDQYTWKVTDHSTLNGKVGITVTAKAGYAFPDGARTRWTRTQDNSPCVIAVPTAPVWTDACGPDDNGRFSGYTDTDQYTWKVTDHSTLNGKVGITVTAKAGYAFPDGARTRWTRNQDNSRCAAAITATTTAQTCTTSGQSVPGSLTLTTTHIRSAYVYVGARTGTKAGDLRALAPGEYLVIASAEGGVRLHHRARRVEAQPHPRRRRQRRQGQSRADHRCHHLLTPSTAVSTPRLEACSLPDFERRSRAGTRARGTTGQTVRSS